MVADEAVSARDKGSGAAGSDWLVLTRAPNSQASLTTILWAPCHNTMRPSSGNCS